MSAGLRAQRLRLRRGVTRMPCARMTSWGVGSMGMWRCGLSGRLRGSISFAVYVSGTQTGRHPRDISLAWWVDLLAVAAQGARSRPDRRRSCCPGNRPCASKIPRMGPRFSKYWATSTSFGIGSPFDNAIGNPGNSRTLLGPCAASGLSSLLCNADLATESTRGTTRRQLATSQEFRPAIRYRSARAVSGELDMIVAPVSGGCARRA
jgi:hypothetical protein